MTYIQFKKTLNILYFWLKFQEHIIWNDQLFRNYFKKIHFYIYYRDKFIECVNQMDRVVYLCLDWHVLHIKNWTW